MNPQVPPHKREKIFRILVAAIALVSILAAVVYSLYGILSDVNATHRLLLEAFMAKDKETLSPALPPETSEDSLSSDSPTPTERRSVSLDLTHSDRTIENATSYTLDETALNEYRFDAHLFDTRPMILLYHSEPMASYWQEGAASVPVSHPFTSENREETVIALGNVVSDVLESAGIASIHLTEKVSDPAKTLGEYRLLYPSIRYCLDIRRDGIYTTDGRIVRSRGTIDGEETAQLMLAVGCDIENRTLDWQKNLAAAYRIAAMLRSAEPSVIRPIYLRPEALGQQDAVTHLTLFVGTTGNTHAEALRSARFFARYLALFILSNCGV
ncbi:MAG: stage II sporulation protein P [Clostridia bacterium]|nr:stage II sporulation protein P [Clostridia bacterium]